MTQVSVPDYLKETQKQIEARECPVVQHIATTECDRCGAAVPNTERYCPHCHNCVGCGG